MKLNSFCIGNFKSFGPIAQEIPLKPVTLIFGPNSAGKSSIIHSLLWLNHVFETGEFDVVKPRNGEGKVDLGGFGQFLHRGENSREVIWGGSLARDQLSEHFHEEWACNDKVDFSLGIGRTREGRLGLTTFEVIIDGRELLRLSTRANRSSRIDLLDFTHPALQPCLAKFGEMGFEDMEVMEQENLPMAQYRGEDIRSYLDVLVNRDGYKIIHSQLFPTRLEKCGSVDVEGLASEDLYHSIQSLVLEFPESLQCLVNEAIPEAFELLFAEIRRYPTATFDALRYLPPLRDLPERSFDQGAVTATIWNILIEDVEVRNQVNAWLGKKQFQTRYRVGLRELIPVSAMDHNLPNAVEHEIVRLLESPESLDILSNLVSELSESFRESFEDRDADLAAYLESDPDLKARLVDEEMALLQENWEDLMDDWPSLSDKQKRGFAYDHVRGVIEPGNVNANLPTGQVWSHYLINSQQFRDHLAANSWEKLDAGKRVSDFILHSNPQIRRELTLFQQPGNLEVSLQDVGVGISQILPILIAAAANRSRLIAIEQPEIHIHPALQSELGDLFLTSALGNSGNAFLLETHSEHLILRILRRIRETTEDEMDDWPDDLKEACPKGISPDDVAVLYVEPGEDGATVKELRIDDFGEFRDKWPGGFFEERAKEIF